MRTCIQDPQWSNSSYLLEEIIVASDGAKSGAGVFAFASAAGINLLFEDAAFSQFLSAAPFELIVGLDAITDTAAIETLLKNIAKLPSLSVRAFVGNGLGMFHPKFCWFRKKGGGFSLVGSGNLTAGGLRGNCEVFSVAALTPSELRAYDHTWRDWVKFHEPELLPLSDPRVIKLAKENAERNRSIKTSQSDILIEESDGKLSVGPARTKDAAVLIAEIPRGGSRWNQANFDLDTFRTFFGASPGRTQRILLTHIDTNGISSPQEVRPSVAVKSHNYRFELEAAAAHSYPVRGRPIAIFVRVATRTFRYRLVMPGDPDYREANTFLKAKCPKHVNRVRRLHTTLSKVRSQSFFRKLAE